MLRVFSLAMFLFCISGCGDSSGVVATDDEMKSYVEENGDLSLDPASQTEIVE